MKNSNLKEKNRRKKDFITSRISGLGMRIEDRTAGPAKVKYHVEFIGIPEEMSRIERQRFNLATVR